jgi:PAS domain S-box-containing protein
MNESEHTKAAFEFSQDQRRKAQPVSGLLDGLTTATLTPVEFQLLAEHIPTLCWIANGDGYIIWYNRRWYEYTGTTSEQMEGWGWQSTHDPEHLPLVLERWKASIASGEPFEMTFPLRGADGVFRDFLTRVQPVKDPSGNVSRWFGVNTEISTEVEIKKALFEEGRRLETLNRVGAALASELDLERLVQRLTDAGVELTGASFGAFFYNVIGDTGESYLLYTLSGVDRSVFANFPMPRNTAVFGPTFRGEGIIRSDDIIADERYGKNKPYHGMPKGHLPVRSYLAVPVVSRSGNVIGGLFFGHPDPRRFEQRHERLMEGVAGQAAIAIDNARLYQSVQRELAHRRVAEERLQQINEALETRIAEEVSIRINAEAQLRQAQKMEAVGQLTGGIAHDFNNLLTLIMGGLDTIRRSQVYGDARLRRATDMALQGAQRAANLTSRLLAFSRRQPLDPRPLDLNVLVHEMTELLRQTLGETVELESVLTPRLWTVELDQNQLESAIINLALNARDAMPYGGRLTIETACTDLDERHTATNHEVLPGEYVMLSISDTGHGMSQATLGRAFEPFFTTKEAERGTGLGLSMVYGFVKQSGGHVTLYSEEGAGTIIKLYFPRFHGAAGDDQSAQVLEAPQAAREAVILVVEDNEEVREYSVSILRELGYNVIEAADADEALNLLAKASRIDLLFTDVVLPGKSGRLLADQAKERWPGLRVLFTTGYSRNAIVHHGRLDPGVRLITKPFTFEQLATRVRDVLDGG